MGSPQVEMAERGPMIGYICGTDWDEELGNADVTVYSNVEEMEQLCPCIKECGIVEVQISFVRRVTEGTI